MDGQAVYRALLQDYKAGTVADISIEKLEKEIQKLSVAESWNKSLEAFIDLWDHKILDLENIQNASVPDATKRKWLTTAVRGHPELYSAVTNAETIEHTMNGLSIGVKALPFDKFYALVRSKAVTIDSRAPPKQAQRRIHQGDRSKSRNGDNRRSSNSKGAYRNSKWWIEPEEWRKMSREQQSEHIRKFREERDSKKDQRNMSKASSQSKDSPKGDTKDNSSSRAPPTAAQRLMSNKSATEPSKTLSVNGLTYTLCTTCV